MNDDIRTMTELMLLELVRIILSKPGPLSGIDKIELAEINSELQRRDLIKLAKQHHPSLAIGGAEK